MLQGNVIANPVTYLAKYLADKNSIDASNDVFVMTQYRNAWMGMHATRLAILLTASMRHVTRNEIQDGRNPIIDIKNDNEKWRLKSLQLRRREDGIPIMYDDEYDDALCVGKYAAILRACEEILLRETGSKVALNKSLTLKFYILNNILFLQLKSVIPKRVDCVYTQWKISCVSTAAICAVVQTNRADGCYFRFVLLNGARLFDFWDNEFTNTQSSVGNSALRKHDMKGNVELYIVLEVSQHKNLQVSILRRTMFETKVRNEKKNGTRDVMYFDNKVCTSNPTIFPKYFPKNLILKNPQSLFLSESESPSFTAIQNNRARVDVVRIVTALMDWKRNYSASSRV
ncbi:hypothetical protein ANN_15440 [Periplaneta americana]|uniref:Uncharacterized protein n=1 Tax=Periplaneta americana TaxID=6978 RepID=A0ABQ8SGE1_PERAM|nr:hypothetical protein ANN_15440 [Periplaneta americana]